MKIFTTEDIRAIERRTIEIEGIPSIELVKRYARGAADEIASRWRPNRPMIVFAGSGHTGAQALATTKLLVERGFEPTVFLFNIGGKRLTHECALMRDELLSAAGGKINWQEVENNFQMPVFTRHHIVIDGLFGSELCEPLKGGFVVIAREINESKEKPTVVSIDVPSGLFGDLNPYTVNRDIIHASLTLAVQMPRIAFFLRDNAELVGEWRTIDIGLSQDIIAATKTSYRLIEGHELKKELKPRNPFADKSDFGSALIVAGCYGMMGAATLACRGALRGGAGKVTVHAPQCGYEIMQTSVPEALFHPDSNKIVISDMKPVHDFTAIGVGPGIGTNDLTINALELFLKTQTKPVVLDADALNCIAARPTMLRDIPVMSVITPHAAEFDRLFGECHSDDARLLKAIEMSHELKIIILLKGHHTAIVRPDYKVYFNSTGTPAMATGGSGDVLTGMITGIMAQGVSPHFSAIIATYIHGLAGELAAREHGEMGVTAGDIAANIGRAFRQVTAN
ncbi:MAG: NAD(P)H-hydrate dehydratase [Bacteroides sp.]|nr:NAD(P)H-hydrate dehydratase [Bacteroides sp.]